MRFQGDCYRAHEPRFAATPLSGEGARARGGRFNPAGIPALYLALTVEGMFAEMGHGFARRFDPLTICAYAADMADVVDLRTEALCTAASVASADLACAWAYELAMSHDPASWRVARLLIFQGAAGVLVPSFATGARADAANLVLWRWGPDLPHQLTVHDPREKLPRDQESWRQ